MKKRGIFSLVVLLALSTLFAAQTTIDIGTAYELVISDVAFAQAETNNSSSVSVITRKQIEAYNADSTAELINKAIGTNFNSYGALGALQSVVIRGARSSKNLIFLDGVLISSIHDGEVDLSLISVSAIDRIEIIKSGTGNLGRTSAVGGMINIITKQGKSTDTPFSVTVENGSFLPEAHGASNEHNWRSLADSQKVDVVYANTLQGTNLAANVGGIVAQNAYTYTDNSTIKALRDNAQFSAVHGGINVNRAFGENVLVSSSNLANYKNVGLPGPYGSHRPNDYQTDILLSTKNSIIFTNFKTSLESVRTDFNYTYAKTYYNGYSISTHNKNKGNVLVEGNWNFGDAYNVVTGADIAFDYIDSSNIDKKTGISPALYAHASIYMLGGDLSLHPSANLAYLGDREALSPNASLGAIYNLGQDTDVKANVSYAEKPPTFSDLYWVDPDFGATGNINLKTERGIQGDVGFSTRFKPLSYEGTVFGKNIFNEIILDSSFTPQNLGQSVYFGTEQAVTLDLDKMFALSASYQYIKSFNLSGTNSFSDNVEVDFVRNHTAKASASFRYSIFDTILSGEYLGKSNKTDAAFVLNLSLNAQVTEELKVYIAIDNLLNASYELYDKYPMPGTKIRLGGKLRF